MNHAIADGYLVANVFRLLEKEIEAFTLGKLKVDGDVGKALEFSKLLK